MQIPAKAACVGTKSFEVVVVDDNRTNQTVIGGILHSAGHLPMVVDAGDAALNLLMTGSGVDAVIMDISMPNMDGVETTRLLRYAEVGVKQDIRLPVIALTAEGGAKRQQACREAGMDAFLTHPVAPAELLEVLSALVEKRRDAQQKLSKPGSSLLTPIVEHADFRVVAQRSVRGDVLEQLHSVGGAPFLRSLGDEFQRDAGIALSFMNKAVETGDVDLFKHQVSSLNSAATALGSTTIPAIQQTISVLPTNYLATVGPLVLAHLTQETATLVDALNHYNAAPLRLV